MAYLARLPSLPLRPFVERLWTHERRGTAAASREWCLPTGVADLVLPLQGVAPLRLAGPGDAAGRRYPQGVLQGPRDQSFLRGTGGDCVVVGAQFTPAGLSALLREGAATWTGASWCASDLWPGLCDEVSQRAHPCGGLCDAQARLLALDQALRARLHPRCHLDERVAHAVAALAAGQGVGAVQRASGWSPTSFIAAYRAAVGLSPKRHADVMRLQRVLQAAGGALSWAALAADAGYADQSHLSRHFTRLTGLTPGLYRRQRTTYPHHVRADWKIIQDSRLPTRQAA
ncbi:MAG: AraC family transcriptional regulator [Rubrivivax sp.]